MLATITLLVIALAVSADEPQTAEDYAQQYKPAGEWEILFDDGSITLDEYARQLDHFGIELGAVSKNGQIQYASQLSRRKPERRIGSKELEKRVSIIWKRGTLVAVDRKLLARAGISTVDKELRHFYPAEVAKMCSSLETSHTDRPPGEIKRTRFKVRPKSNAQDGYEFYVDEQEYRSPGEKSEKK